MKYLIIWLLVSSRTMPAIEYQEGTTLNSFFEIPPQSGYAITETLDDAKSFIRAYYQGYVVKLFEIKSIKEIDFEIEYEPIEKTITEHTPKVVLKHYHPDNQ